jgi:hypothetical protein
MTTTQIPATDTATKVSTRTLLGCGAVSGPLWTVVSPARHPRRDVGTDAGHRRDRGDALDLRSRRPLPPQPLTFLHIRHRD